MIRLELEHKFLKLKEFKNLIVFCMWRNFFIQVFVLTLLANFMAIAKSIWMENLVCILIESFSVNKNILDETMLSLE